MKKQLKNVIAVILFTITAVLQAQTPNYVLQGNYFQISPRVGYDLLPMYNNNTPYIDYKGGLELGLSLDYYWQWFGVGADFDYIKNRPKSTFPTTNLFNASGVPLTSFSLTENSITRMFYGIGPDFQYRNPTGTFTAELNTRAGLGSVNGGKTELKETSTSANQLLNFHAGYAQSSVFTTKAQLRFNYFVSPVFALHLGGYYMRHFGVDENFDTTNGMSAGYAPFTESQGEVGLNQSQMTFREEPCNCDISSIGAFVGFTYIPKARVKEKECTTCGCTLTVTAKDKFTGQLLPNTDVVLVTMDGKVVQSGTTNSFGTVVFNSCVADNYVVRGKLYQVNLEETAVAKSEFDHCKKNGGIQKEIVYADRNFILKGKVVECNSAKGIQGVDIILKEKSGAGEKHSLSDIDGNFVFQLKQSADFTLKGVKDGYFSNNVEVSTQNLDRNTTLFIDFEMCIDPCGKAIRLNNINFELAKWDILPQSYADLNYVVKLMKDNPNISVEMSSHTDCRGTNEYNQDLSQKRAQSTVDYIVSKGIDRSRLMARGAGETELLNRCADGVNCSEDEHAINRRTEFKVICK